MTVSAQSSAARVGRARAWLVGGAYAVLGLLLVATRLVGLDQGLWHDEVIAVVQFIRGGPDAILAGTHLNHEAFGILAWATSAVVGESEVTLRVWSVLPFLVGVAIGTSWLHVRQSPLAGIAFLYLAALSPLLLDISRQARGYGLAFLAMTMLLVGALETQRTKRTAALVAFCLGGVLGACTLPQLGIAFLATGGVLAIDAQVRRRVLGSVIASSIAIALWYAPHLGQVRDASQIEDGSRIRAVELAVAPFQHVLIPAFLWIDGIVVSRVAFWLPLVLVAAIVLAYSPLLRRRETALVLCCGVVVTLVVLWIVQAFVIPRYLSFLLVPLLFLVASGAGEILARLRTRPAAVGTLAVAVVFTLVTTSFLSVVSDVLRYPREAYRDVARTLAAETSDETPVVVYLRNTEGLDFYLDRPFTPLEAAEVRSAVCESARLVAYVHQPFGIPEVDVPCLDRPGVERFVHRQYARGGEMQVWLVPPRPSGN